MSHKKNLQDPEIINKSGEANFCNMFTFQDFLTLLLFFSCEILKCFSSSVKQNNLLTAERHIQPVIRCNEQALFGYKGY